VEAFSSLGWLPDPVHSPMLEREDGALIEVVIHEMAHNTVYAPGHSAFNETLATFIGRTGARLFFESQGEAGREVSEDLHQRYYDQDLFNAWLRELAEDLNAYYAQPIAYDQKVAGREAVYQAARDRFVLEAQPAMNHPDRYSYWADVPTNNALVAMHLVYNLDLDLLEALYQQGGGDFAYLLGVLRAAAASSDPWVHLRQQVDSP